MANNSTDLLELLRKRGMDGDADFLREAPQVLVEGIMDADVSAQIGARHSERSPDRLTHRNGYRKATAAEIGTPGSGPWSCAFPRSEKGVTSLRQRRTGTQATQ